MFLTDESNIYTVQIKIQLLIILSLDDRGAIHRFSAAFVKVRIVQRVRSILQLDLLHPYHQLV